MTKFRSDHDIPNDVLIERPCPNKVATVLEVEDCILVCTWLTHQAGLQFLISPMLKEVMACYRLTFMQGSVNFVRTMLSVDTLMRREGLQFNAYDLLHMYTVLRPLKKKPNTNLCTGIHYV